MLYLKCKIVYVCNFFLRLMIIILEAVQRIWSHNFVFQMEHNVNVNTTIAEIL